MPPGTSGPPEGEASQEGCGDMKGTRLQRRGAPGSELRRREDLPGECGTLLRD